MALESTTKISGLVDTNPTATDVVSQGDNHLRLIKKVLKTSFPSDVDVQIPSITGKGSHYLTTNGDATAIEWAEFPDLTALLSRVGEMQRPKFQKVGANVLRINPCNYHVSGKGNVNIDSPVDLSGITGSGWQYIYIDASKISPTSTFERLSVTASSLYASGTKPTYSTGITKRGWYNGEDRCIFAVYVEGGILDFTHDGGTHVLWDTDRNDGTHNGLSWATKTLSVPPLPDMVGIAGFFANGTTELNGYDYRYRRPGTGGEHYMGRTEDDESEFLINDMIVQTTNGQIEVNIGRWMNNGGSGTPTLYIKTRGFLLPGGM